MQLILVVISSAAFFGLVVLGRGGFEVFFSNPGAAT
jgi:hypothetical protein